MGCISEKMFYMSGVDKPILYILAEIDKYNIDMGVDNIEELGKIVHQLQLDGFPQLYEFSKGLVRDYYSEDFTADIVDIGCSYKFYENILKKEYMSIIFNTMGGLGYVKRR